MANKYLDDIGLAYFFNKLKNLFASKDTATQSNDGLMSYSDKIKLDNLNISLPLSISNGGTGATTAADALANLGIGAFGRFSGVSSNTTLATSGAKMPLKTFSGVGCSSSSNGIKFNSVGYYLICGTIYITTGGTENDILHVQIRVNDVLIVEYLYRSPRTGDLYQNFTVGPWLYYASDANQVAYLYAYNQTAARSVVADVNGTNLIVVKIR